MLRRDGGFIYLCFHVVANSISLASPRAAKLTHFVAPPFPTKSLILWGAPSASRILLLKNPAFVLYLTSQNPPVLLPRKSVCCHTLLHRRVRRQPLSSVSRKQRYNTLDFPAENRVPTGMLCAPIGNPASKGIFPSELPVFSSQTGTQTVKTQFGTPAQKMQKEVRTDEWRTSFFADNLKSLRYSFRLSAPARGHDA